MAMFLELQLALVLCILLRIKKCVKGERCAQETQGALQTARQGSFTQVFLGECLLRGVEALRRLPRL